MKPPGRWFYILNETNSDGIACGVSPMFRRNAATDEDTLTLDAPSYREKSAPDLALSCRTRPEGPAFLDSRSHGNDGP